MLCCVQELVRAQNELNEATRAAESVRARSGEEREKARESEQQVAAARAKCRELKRALAEQTHRHEQHQSQLNKWVTRLASPSRFLLETSVDVEIEYNH